MANRESFLEKYLSPEHSAEAIEEAKNDLSLLEQVLKLELALSNAKKNAVLAGSESLSLKIEEIYQLGEEFIGARENNSLGEIDLESTKWQKLWQNSANFSYFQEIVNSIQGPDDNLATPDYLRNIVKQRLRTKAAKKEEGILIRIKDGLQLIGGYLDNVFALPEQNEAFAVRSSMAMQGNAMQTAGILQFYTTEKDEQKILYQVVKDGNDTVMLTVKLQDFKPLPKTMKIQREGRLLHSFPVKEDFAYFPQLMPGEYIIDLVDRHGNNVKSIDINLLSD